MTKKELKVIGEAFADALHRCGSVAERVGALNAQKNMYNLVAAGLITHDKYMLLEDAFRARIDTLEPLGTI